MNAAAMSRDHALEAVAAICRRLGAEVDYRPNKLSLTATVRENPCQPDDEAKALSIQKQIQQRTAQYPGLVCYCFDAFSTLVYMV